MDGKIHAVLGAGTGVAVAQTIGMEPVDTAILMSAGVIAGLVPDLDTAGKLANKISLSHKMIQGFVRTVGILAGAYAWFGLEGYAMYVGLALGIFLLVIAPKFSQKLMLLISGVAIIAAGVALTEVWVWLSGIYVAAAALVGHRSYTHSIAGLLFFAVIAFYINERFALEGLFWALVLGYASHLLADMRLVPGNKRGIKLFLPFSQKLI
ncbi:inner membrane protein [Lentibacillus persicus]|uniref:Inner membrane protein n=1 Tax=Lentibacillus persicus TaxID=640948 RepID=A0A1I1UC84_9BACI|nr:metal-dependent hydrolase [Lentibacillus persicus]SFD68452.1 inner membrane protein [Lentibacillus persicus]